MTQLQASAGVAAVPEARAQCTDQADARLRVRGAVSSRNDRVSLLAVLLAGALVRIAYLVELWRSPLFLLNSLPGPDMATYYSLARGFADGRVPDAPLFQAPLYPLLLAGIVRLVGPSIAALMAAQVVLGVIGCIVLYELGRELASPAVGLVAAALYGAYPLAWYYGGLLLSENLLAVLLPALALAAAKALRHGRAGAWLSVGVLCGLATLTKANVLLALPALLAAAFMVRPRATTLWTSALACVACAAVVLPASVFNSVQAGAPQFVSGQGTHLWLAGNSEYATGLYQLPCGPALAFTDPRFWLLQVRKLLLFFSNEEFGNNTWVGVFQAHVWLPAIGFGLPAALGLLGFGTAVRWSRGWLGLAIVLTSYVVGIAAFAIVGRYRLPAAAVLCVPAATCLASVRRLPRRRLAGAAVCAATLTVAANVALPPDVSVPFAHANAATVFSIAGDSTTAQTELQQAHAARLAVEAQDPHACSQLPAF